MALDSAALGSAADTLDDLIQRLRVLAAAGGDDDATNELHEVERQLTTASRRLAKALRKL